MENPVFEEALAEHHRYHLDRNNMLDPLSFGEIDLYQIGRLYFNPDDRVILHSNMTVLELTSVLGGAGWVEINGDALPVERGDIQLTFPGDLHAIRPDKKDPLKFDFCALWSADPMILPLLEETVKLCKENGISVIRDQRISDLIGNAIGELASPDRWTDAVVAGMLREILFLVFRAVRTGSREKHLAVSFPDELCYGMMNYIDTHIYSLKNLSALGEAMNYNYSYLSDLFRTTTGNTLQNYLRERRLERAKLLIDEGYSFARIAEMLQYGSVYSFHRAFREQYGLPPGEYRKKKEQR